MLAIHIQKIFFILFYGLETKVCGYSQRLNEQSINKKYCFNNIVNRTFNADEKIYDKMVAYCDYHGIKIQSFINNAIKEKLKIEVAN